MSEIEKAKQILESYELIRKTESERCLKIIKRVFAEFLTYQDATLKELLEDIEKNIKDC